jgi:EmrB/QacA subfamily drug resistance transporter
MIAVMTVAALMDMLDVTVVNVALPTLRHKLHAGPTQLEWLIAGYLLAFGSTLLVWGRIGDVVGRRRVFLGAVAGFGLASLGAGLSHSIGMLVAFRVVQGVAAGALVPQVLATFRSQLDHQKRIVAFGLYGAVAGLAAAAGVVLGGVLTEYSLFGLGWRAIFLVNVPVAAVVLLIGSSAVPDSRPEVRRSLDPLGMVLVPLSLSAIVYALLEGRTEHWAGWIQGLLVAGIFGAAASVVAERRRMSVGVEPLLDVTQFRRRSFAAGIGVQMLFSAALQGFSLGYVLWLQVGHGNSPVRTGLTLLAFSAGAIFTAPVAGKLAEARGRSVLTSGAALLVVGVSIVGIPAWTHSSGASLWASLGGLFVAGAGLGLLVVPLVNVVLAAVPVEAAGGASGTFSTAQQLGGAIGIAVIGSVFFGATPDKHLNGSFAAIMPWVAVAFGLAGLISLALPRTALTEEQMVDL